jgi:hypothetical protein
MAIVLDRCVDYVQGHPQCLRNVTTTGLPSSAGMCSLSVEGALDPTAAGEETASLDGERQDASSCLKVILAERIV